jgi:hypothetical protein
VFAKIPGGLGGLGGLALFLGEYEMFSHRHKTAKWRPKKPMRQPCKKGLIPWSLWGILREFCVVFLGAHVAPLEPLAKSPKFLMFERVQTPGRVDPLAKSGRRL